MSATFKALAPEHTPIIHPARSTRDKVAAQDTHLLGGSRDEMAINEFGQHSLPVTQTKVVVGDVSDHMAETEQGCSF